MSKCISAHTNPGCNFPGYINFSREADGSITVHFRGDPQEVNGCFVCANLADKGKSGRCFPGDDNCNNYCNMAPAKGPMQRSPKDCVQVIEGANASLKMTAEAFEAFIAPLM